MAIIPLLAAIGSVSSSVTPYSPPLAEAKFPDFIDSNVPSSCQEPVEESEHVRIYTPLAQDEDDDVEHFAKTGTLIQDVFLALQAWHKLSSTFIFSNPGVSANNAELVLANERVQKAALVLNEYAKKGKWAKAEATTS